MIAFQLGFYYFRHLFTRWKGVCVAAHNDLHELPK